jgi:hypothetical protein
MTTPKKSRLKPSANRPAPKQKPITVEPQGGGGDHSHNNIFLMENGPSSDKSHSGENSQKEVSSRPLKQRSRAPFPLVWSRRFARIKLAAAVRHTVRAEPSRTSYGWHPRTAPAAKLNRRRTATSDDVISVCMIRVQRILFVSRPVNREGGQRCELPSSSETYVRNAIAGLCRSVGQYSSIERARMK